MIQVNKANISKDASEIYLDLETEQGSRIISLLAWKDSTFKDYIKAIDLSYLLQNTSNREILSINADLLELNNLEGLFFIEAVDDSNLPQNCSECSNEQLIILTNFNNIYRCMAKDLNKVNGCISSQVDLGGCCDQSLVSKVITINNILESVKINLKINNFVMAIEQYKKLGRFCSDCINVNYKHNTPCNNCD